LSSASIESVMSFNPSESGLTGTRGHQDGIGWDEGWRDDAESMNSTAGSGQRKRKAAGPPRGLVAPQSVVSEVRGSHRIQWDEKPLGKSIKNTGIRDWIILN
jgi:hypothetical protein